MRSAAGRWGRPLPRCRRCGRRALDAWGVAPQPLQLVQVPSWLIHHVHDDLPEVEEHPQQLMREDAAGRPASSGRPTSAGCAFGMPERAADLVEGPFKMLLDGRHLWLAGCRADDKVVGDAGEAAKIQDGDMLRVFLNDGPGRDQRDLSTSNRRGTTRLRPPRVERSRRAEIGRDILERARWALTSPGCGTSRSRRSDTSP